MSPLPLDKRAKLIKLMQLAQSENDNEALSSLRAATKILRQHNLDWERMFNAIDERKIIAWENDEGLTSFRPHSWAFDDPNMDDKQLQASKKQKVIIAPAPEPYDCGGFLKTTEEIEP
jgi:hypothetical protein